MHLGKGEYEQAIAEFREVLVYHPNDADVRKAIATCLRAIGDDASAASEAEEAQKTLARAIAHWAQFQSREIPMYWEGELIGYFRVSPVLDDYPRIRGGWTSSGSRRAREFERILLRVDYCARSDLLRVRLGPDMAGECLVNSAPQIADQSGRVVGHYLQLTVITPPSAPHG